MHASFVSEENVNQSVDIVADLAAEAEYFAHTFLRQHAIKLSSSLQVCPQ